MFDVVLEKGINFGCKAIKLDNFIKYYKIRAPKWEAISLNKEDTEILLHNIGNI
jgi:hypothetical protein